MTKFKVRIGFLDDSVNEYENTMVDINNCDIDEFGTNPEKFIKNYNFENIHFVSEIDYL